MIPVAQLTFEMLSRGAVLRTEGRNLRLEHGHLLPEWLRQELLQRVAEVGEWLTSANPPPGPPPPETWPPSHGGAPTPDEWAAHREHCYQAGMAEVRRRHGLLPGAELPPERAQGHREASAPAAAAAAPVVAQGPEPTVDRWAGLGPAQDRAIEAVRAWVRERSSCQ